MNGAARAVLDERGCGKIHEAALTLLEEVGCAVLDPEALALLKANGARVDGERARFGEALVERARSTAPARYTVAGRRPELDLHVGLGEPAVLASASGPPFVLSGGEYRTGTLDGPHDGGAARAPLAQHRRARLQHRAERRAGGAAAQGRRPPARDLERQELPLHGDVPGRAPGGHGRARDPARRGLARTAAPLVGHQYDVPAAVLGGGRAGRPAPGAPRPAGPRRRLRHGRDDGADHAGRPARRAARGAARRSRAHATRQPRHAVPVRRHLVALVHAERRAHDRRAGVLVTHGGDRATRPLAGRPGARRRLRHRRAPPRRPGRHRVRARHGHGPPHRRAVRAPCGRHPLVLQLLLAREVRDRRRGAQRTARRAATDRGGRGDTGPRRASRPLARAAPCSATRTRAGTRGTACGGPS